MSDLSNQIETIAGQPKSVTVDGNSATQHPLKDLIAADEYLDKKAGATKSNLGIRFTRFNPPGVR